MSTKKDDIFSGHKASQVAYGDCPKCDAPLQMKHVGKSSFLGCTDYPKCDYSQSLNKQDVTTIKHIDDSHCPECDSQLAVKKGRYGMFIGCTNFPDCHFISTNQNKQNKSEYEPVVCPSCNVGKLDMRQNRFGKFFYACNNYPKCKYVLNQQPVNKGCPKCKASIMLVKTRGEAVYICAHENCGHVIDETR